MTAKQTQTEQAQVRQQGGLASAGATLASAREEQQLTVEAVASELHLRPEVVRALEAGDEAQLPSTFVRGYTKAYARLLGLDEAAIVGQLPGINERSPAPLKRIGVSRRRVAPPVGRSLLWGAALLCLVFVAGYGVPALQRLWSGWTSESPSDQLHIPLPGDGEIAAPETSEPDAVEVVDLPREDTVTAAEAEAGRPEAGRPEADPVAVEQVGDEVVAGVPETAPAPPADAPPEPETQPVASEEDTQGPAVVQLRFTQDSWVEMEANGRKLVVGTQRAGTERKVRAEPPVELLLGNAPGVEVSFRGKSVDVSAHQRGNVARLTLED